VWFALIGGGLFLVVGLVYSLLFDMPAESETKKAAKDAAKKSQHAKTPEGKVDAEAQGAVDSAIKSVADLAGSLKDLTVGARLALIGVLLVALGAVAAGADALGDASKDNPSPSHKTTTQRHPSPSNTTKRRPHPSPSHKTTSHSHRR
jgi:hypothetical protein